VARFLRDWGLSLVLLGLFAACWAGQAIVGRGDYNDEREERGLPRVSVAEYLGSSHFLEATMENWESEFLQMAAYVFLTVHLFQRGSSESKDPDEATSPQDEDPRTQRNRPEAPWPVKRGGWVLWLYERSLGLAFVALFASSAVLHAIGGARLYSEEQAALGEPAVSGVEYLCTTRFWFESLQNWQSEFLAIGSMVVLSIFLRHRGSPESKPVAAGHWETGAE
jgi:hypothetical protein